MTEQRRLTVQLAVIHAVKKAVQETEAAVKDRLKEVMDPGDRKHATLDGHDLGTVTYSTTTTIAKVRDREEFAGWVARAHPTEVSYPVTLQAAEVLALIDIAFEDQALIDRLERKAHTARPVVNPAYEEHLMQVIAANRIAVDVETGEMIPGVTIQPAGQPGYISVRVSEHQEEAIRECVTFGRLDAFGLATTPPAIEGSPR